MSTQLTVDLKKVQWARYWWINGKGDERRTEPSYLTVNGTPIVSDEIAFPSDPAYPRESVGARAIRRRMLDKWKPVCSLTISANRTLTFTGEKATKIWKAYNKRIYGK